MDELDIIALERACPYCGEDPGEWCRSRRTRRKSPYLHADRTRSLWDAWRSGYRHGQEHVVMVIDTNTDRGDTAAEQARWRTWLAGFLQSIRERTPHGD